MNPDDAAPDANPPEVQPPEVGEAGGAESEPGPAGSESAPASADVEAEGGAELAPGGDGSAEAAGQGGVSGTDSSTSDRGEGTSSSLPHAEHHHATHSQIPVEGQPTFILFGVVSSVSLLLDVVSKGWAEVVLQNRPTHPITLIEDHLSLTLAYNPGGAWGLLTNQPEDIRKPFFVFVSVAAILFIVSLYGRLAPGQRALTWGLPLVLGGALGNLADRITRSKVIDFIDYRADWVRSMNELVAKYFGNWSVTDHWPTFNVADIAICVGVGLMAVDMITSRRGSHHPPDPDPKRVEPPPQPAPEGPQPSS